MKCINSKTCLATLFIISLALTGLWGVNDAAGTTGFNTLKIVYSARAVAMGQAQTGLVRNPDGIYFNPAALLNIPSPEIGTTYSNYFLDSQGGQLQYMLPRSKYLAWGFGLKYLNMGSMDRTEADPQSNDLIDTGETFGAYNLIASASVAKYMNPMLDFGATAKLIYDQIDDKSAAAAVIDLGLMHHPTNKKVKVGVSLRNLGLQVKYYTDSKYKESLPFTAAAGIGYEFNPRLQGSLDLNKATGENIVAKLGLEYALYPTLDLRMGLRSDAGDQNIGGGLGWTSGLSLGAGWVWRNYRMDYALSSYGDLGFINQLSLNYEF